jgi:sec-independent protein translocase protein TatA
MFKNIGTGEIIIIAVVIMILFGSKKLPEFTRALGESAKEFKKGYKTDGSKKSDEPEDNNK